MTVLHTTLAIGQQQARARWGTHASGEAFDRKKSSYLTEQAQQFLAQQAICVVAGLDLQNELSGLLVLGTPGFVQTPDEHTCLLRLDKHLGNSRILQRVRQSPQNGQVGQPGLFFICHPTRERLCVHGTAELLPPGPIDQPSQLHESTWMRLQVGQSFFHCSKYIKTRVAGLTHPGIVSPERMWQLHHLHGYSQQHLSEAVSAFISEQVLCFLCTVDQEGRCAVNHRGGAPGFLVTLPPDAASPGGTVLLPDYAGNGAFEAIGNILETGQVALVIPNYVAHLALCVSGWARIVELGQLSTELAHNCRGAGRVIVLSVQRVEAQHGDWSATLAYERARAESLQTNASNACHV